jgi:hypothetical protein
MAFGKKPKMGMNGCFSLALTYQAKYISSRWDLNARKSQRDEVYLG